MNSFITSLGVVIGLVSGITGIITFFESRKNDAFKNPAIIFFALSFIVLLAIAIEHIIPYGADTSTSVRSGPGSDSTPPSLQKVATNPLPTPTNVLIPAANPTSTAYAQLRAFYSGIAVGSTNANITFTLKSEGRQGNLIMETTFQHIDDPQKFAHYLCQGSVTTDRKLSLHCTQEEDHTYLLDVQGSIDENSNIAGTEVATNTNDSTYNNRYAWSVS